MRWLLLPLLLPVALLVGLFFLFTDARPNLTRDAQVTLADLDRGKAIVDSLGLRRMREGEVRQLVLTEADLDKGLNYLASRFSYRSVSGSASARIALSELIVQASLPLPVPGLRRFVNLELAMQSADDQLQPVRLRIGKLRMPAGMTADFSLRALVRTPLGSDWKAARAMLNSAQISGQTLALRFTWSGAALDQVRGGVVARGVDEALLARYRAKLQQANSRDFTVLLGAAFALAQSRSGDNDPITENRAALTSLAEIALGGRLLSRRALLAGERRSGIKLAGRGDFSQHFALSAFLSATGGESLSDMAGLYKELQDARGGSGFSFADLAADRAGSLLGEAGTRSRASAVDIQRRLAGVRDAKVFFPAVRDLPEFMKQAEFERRFGGVGQPAYQKMVDRIEAHLDALPLYSD